jgi:hypothetical protein
MIVKIYRERVKNKKSSGRGGEERTSHTIIILRHHKNFRGARQKEKEMVRTGQE